MDLFNINNLHFLHYLFNMSGDRSGNARPSFNFPDSCLRRNIILLERP